MRMSLVPNARLGFETARNWSHGLGPALVPDLWCQLLSRRRPLTDTGIGIAVCETALI